MDFIYSCLVCLYGCILHVGFFLSPWCTYSICLHHITDVTCLHGPPKSTTIADVLPKLNIVIMAKLGWALEDSVPTWVVPFKILKKKLSNLFIIYWYWVPPHTLQITLLLKGLSLTQSYWYTTNGMVFIWNLTLQVNCYYLHEIYEKLRRDCKWQWENAKFIRLLIWKFNLFFKYLYENIASHEF